MQASMHPGLTLGERSEIELHQQNLFTNLIHIFEENGVVR